MKKFFYNNKFKIFVFLLFFILIFNSSLFEIIKSFQYKRNLKNKIFDLNNNIFVLKKEIYNLQYNKNYIEFLAHKNLSMCYENEIIYKFKND